MDDIKTMTFNNERREWSETELVSGCFFFELRAEKSMPYARYWLGDTPKMSIGTHTQISVIVTSLNFRVLTCYSGSEERKKLFF